MTQESTKASAWYVYLLQCADDTLYAGVTTDVERRVREHNGERVGGARYTRARRPVTLVYREACADRASAGRREAAIKALDRRVKWTLVNRARDKQKETID